MSKRRNQEYPRHGESRRQNLEGRTQILVVHQSQLGEQWQPGYRLEPGDTWHRRWRLDAECEGIKVELDLAVAVCLTLKNKGWGLLGTLRKKSALLCFR